MNPLDRDPKGHFISREAALAAWLPVLLQQSSNELIEMLRAASKHCDSLAADRYLYAHDVLTRNPQRCEKPEEWAKYYVAKADLWFQRKAVLLEAAEKLKGIK